MNIKRTLTFLAFLTAINWGCQRGNAQALPRDNKSTVVSNSRLPQDTVKLRKSFKEEDLPVTEYLKERLQPIRANFKRINSVTNWTSIEAHNLLETTEGGTATFYYLNGTLEEIVTRHFGETFQQLTEYYLLNGQLSFVFERSYEYNRSLYYDSAAMKENDATETFDLKQSQIVEDRSYFEHGKLLHQVNNQDCGSPFAADYLLEEQKRIMADFEQVIGYRKEQRKSDR